jgi:hypothetical protein
MTTAKPRSTNRPDQEVWELTVAGRVSMEVSGDRGGTKLLTVKGEGQVLRITTFDREIVEEGVIVPSLNPFRNGSLVRVDGHKKTRTDAASTDELAKDELQEMFNLDNVDFEALLPQLSEVNVRRLQTMSKTADVRHAQVEILSEYIAEHFAVGGSQPSYDEMMAPQKP